MACDSINAGHCGNGANPIPVGDLVTSNIITISSKCYTNCPIVCNSAVSYANLCTSNTNSYSVN
jgi:hypothetical protein